MKTVYEASHTVEAHVVLNLLGQSGVNGTISGEYLQGGIGEIPAAGFVRVQVEPEDYERAKAIIDEWEVRQPDTPAAAPSASSNGGAFLALVVGLVVGAAGMYMMHQTPRTDDGIDYDGDGINEERWHYNGNRPSKTEFDRNADGQVDQVLDFDRRGLMRQLRDDQDFDGEFEGVTEFLNGNPVETRIDHDRDGVYEFILVYDDGVPVEATWYDPDGLKPLKKQYFEGTRLVSAELDTDGDGVLDTTVEYDDIEEIRRRYPIPR